MKFSLVVVVLFALAVGAHSSIVPVGPIVIANDHLPAAVSIHAVPSAPIQLITSPVVVPQVVAVAPAEGTYVAKTRGTLHVAPLAGHANSAASVNLEPAPGTI